jgi:hypothetical protein
MRRIRVLGRGRAGLTGTGQNIDWHSDNGTHQALCKRVPVVAADGSLGAQGLSRQSCVAVGDSRGGWSSVAA